MELRLTPDFERKLGDSAALTGRAPVDLLEDALAGYSFELTQARQTLDSRYDDMKTGRVQPVDGETFFEGLRKREEEIMNLRSS